MNKRHTGSFYEDIAADYLLKNDYRIIKRNYSCKAGEIDIIAIKDDILRFIEVKYRKDTEFGYSAEAVSKAKQKTIRKCAQWFITENNIGDNVCCSFDVVAIQADNIEYLFNAYGAI